MITEHTVFVQFKERTEDQIADAFGLKRAGTIYDLDKMHVSIADGFELVHVEVKLVCEVRKTKGIEITEE